MVKIESSIENWENGALGMDAAFAVRASDEEAVAIDKATGMQLISIRLERELITALKAIAKYHGIGYQPMVRDLMHRFAISESKVIYGKLLEEATKKEMDAGEPMAPVGDFMRRTA
jgi:polysaccharide pyruvyl transferase WcaK-like protein